MAQEHKTERYNNFSEPTKWQVYCVYASKYNQLVSILCSIEYLQIHQHILDV